MLLNDKKKAVTIMLAKLGKGGAPDSPPEAPKMKDGTRQDDSIALESAAEDILKAIESKDAQSLVTALQDFYDLCDDDGDETESDSEGA